MDKKIFVFYGPGGSGKNTIVSSVYDNLTHVANVEGFNTDDIELLVPITTRERRPNEVDGVDYIFMNEDDPDFKHLVEDKDGQISNYKYNIIDKNGNEKIVHYIYPYPNKPLSILISNPQTVYKLMTDKHLKLDLRIFYIIAKKETLLYRLITRELKDKNPNIKEVVRRFMSDLKDFSESPDNLYRNVVLPPGDPHRYNNDADFDSIDKNNRENFGRIVLKITSEIIKTITDENSSSSKLKSYDRLYERMMNAVCKAD